MAKEESGGKFPPLLIHSGMRIKRQKGKLKRNENGIKQKNSGEKKRKGKQIESRAREREKKRGFHLLSKIYGDRAVGFHQSKRQSWST